MSNLTVIIRRSRSTGITVRVDLQEKALRQASGEDEELEREIKEELGAVTEQLVALLARGCKDPEQLRALLARTRLALIAVDSEVDLEEAVQSLGAQGVELVRRTFARIHRT